MHFLLLHLISFVFFAKFARFCNLKSERRHFIAAWHYKRGNVIAYIL